MDEKGIGRACQGIVKLDFAQRKIGSAGSVVRRIRTRLCKDSRAVPYAAQKPRHSAGAAVRFCLKWSRLESGHIIFHTLSGIHLLARRQLDATLLSRQGEPVLSEDDEEIPEYLKALEVRGKVVQEDNFGPEDVAWTGTDGTLDPDELIQQMGREHRTPLFQVVRAMIAGHQPGMRQHELEGLTRKVCDQISGQSRPGTTDVDDGPLLLEIAHRYHTALYDAGEWPTGIVPLQPIVRDVVSEFGNAHRKHRMPDTENLAKALGRKFKKEKDLWLSRATTEDPLYAPNRFNDLKLLINGLRLLAEAGVPLEIHQVRPTKRPTGEGGDKSP